ncbi:MAG: leucine-rich repeat protein, partial [Ruminococcus sp.]|nr:leucine-rich repeat protein [Ruminococcus sp.]
YSGEINDINWDFNPENGVLTLNGSGEMPDYAGDSSYPWYNFRGQIEDIKFEGDITRIGQFCFTHLCRIESISVPESVKQIGYSAFRYSASIKKISLPGVEQIDKYAFVHCTNLSEVTFGNRLHTIGSDAFEDCPSLTSISIPATIAKIDSHALGYTYDYKTQKYYPVPSLDIYGVEGSAAQTYAEKEKSFHFYAVEPPKIIFSGTTGDCQWEYDTVDWILKISGDGATADYASAEDTPWYIWREKFSEVVFDGNITKIGDFFFTGMKNASIVPPESLETIGESAFEECKGLESANLPVLDLLEKNAFKDSGLKSVTFGEELTDIDEGVFSGCKSLLTVSIPDTVTKIGIMAFADSGLESAQLGSSVKTIGREAFLNTKLRSIKIPDSVKSIGAHAFGYIKSDDGTFSPVSFNFVGNPGSAAETYAKTEEKFTFSESAPTSGTTGDCQWSFDESTGTMTISGSGAMEDYDEDTDVPWYSYRSDIKSLVIEDGVTAIGNYSFINSGVSGSVYLPASVDTVGSHAFQGCSSLNDIYLSNVKTIGEEAFAASGILNADLSAAEKIDCKAFDGCSNLSMVTFGDKLTEIGGFAFSHCGNLTSVSIPSGVKNISHCAFSYSGLTSVMFRSDSKLETIGDCAFENCVSLNSIELPDTVTSIGEKAFYASGLEMASVGKSLETIGDNAFVNTRISEITLHGAVSQIGSYALGYSFDPESRIYTVNEYLKINGVTGSAAENYAATENNFIFYPIGGEGRTGDCGWYFNNTSGKLEIFGSGAMAEYENPSDAPWYGMNYIDVSIGKGVEHIGKYCFTDVTGLYIPETVTSISDMAVGFDGEGNPLDTCLIYGNRDSAAQDYADKYENIRFIDLKPRPNYMGSVGAGAAWTFDEDTGVLTVYATAASGYIGDYGQFDSRPWSKLGDNVKKVVIEDNIIAVGDFAFSDMKGIEEVELSKDVKKLGTGAFNNTGLNHLIVPNPECQLGYYCFGYEDSPEGVWFYEMEIADIAGHVGSTAEQYAK